MVLVEVYMEDEEGWYGTAGGVVEGEKLTDGLRRQKCVTPDGMKLLVCFPMTLAWVARLIPKLPVRRTTFHRLLGT